jgi:hypothetical protein
MSKFVLLKRTYPISLFDRKCDGYKYIVENTTEEQRKELGIDLNKLKQTIHRGEKYIYEVGKIGKGKKSSKLEAKHISIKNFEIIRKKIFGTKDD